MGVGILRRACIAGLVVVGGVMSAPAGAASFVVTVENAGAQTTSATFDFAGIERFTTRATTGSATTTNLTTGFGTTGSLSGTYTGVSIVDADVFGGAGGSGRYALARREAGPTASYSIGLSTTDARGINYFGLWISALDAGNSLTFYNGNDQVFTYSAADLISSLSRLSDGASYYGNPNGGGNAGQAYAYVNFFNTSGTFNRIVLSESSAYSGFESDNHVVGNYATMSGRVVGPVPEPSTWMTMILGFGITGWLLRRAGRKSLLAPKHEPQCPQIAMAMAHAGETR